MVSSCGSAYILSAVFSEFVLYSIFVARLYLEHVVIQILWLMLIYENLCKYLRIESNNVQVKLCVSEYWNGISQESSSGDSS